MNSRLTRRQAGQLIAGAALAGLAGTVRAQSSWPARPIKLQLAHPTAGLPDAFARALAEGLTDRLKQTVFVENRPGGSLIIGTDAVAKAQPDGYTLLLGSESSLAINVAAFRKLPYDPVKDLTPVSMIFRTPLFLVVSRHLPVNNVRELVAYAKANPGALSYATLGHGSSLHLAAVMFEALAGINLLHVPYQGPPATIPDILAGRVSMIFDGGAMLPLAREGKLKVLALTSAQRLPTLPELPSMAEAGVPGYDLDFWFNIMAPAGTPAAIVDRLSQEIGDIEKQPAFRQKLSAFHLRFETNTPAEMARIIKNDTERWQKVWRDHKIALQ